MAMGSMLTGFVTEIALSHVQQANTDTTVLTGTLYMNFEPQRLIN